RGRLFGCGCVGCACRAGAYRWLRRLPRPPASSTQATARVPLQRCDTASQRVLRRMAGVN
ncbi:hypothetical protein, partial [Xanthomonas oryzae]|uniref:hypothetical protein n=1 Tax=Xanthomonas oryzae TaxID=347 RepID=UPI003CCFE3F1